MIMSSRLNKNNLGLTEKMKAMAVLKYPKYLTFDQ